MPNLEKDGLSVKDYESYLFNTQKNGELVTLTGEPNRYRRDLIEAKAIKPLYIKDKYAHDKLTAVGWEIIKRCSQYFGHK